MRQYYDFKGILRSVMAQELDYSLELSEFELQLHYYFHFRTNSFWKGMNSRIPPPAIC